MIAKRIASFDVLDQAYICYWKADGIWWIDFPGCGVGNLSNHGIQEHTDGTITVSPSILVEGHFNGEPATVHGYLIHGEWRPC